MRCVEGRAVNTVVNEAMGFVEALARQLSSGELELPTFPDVVVSVRRAVDDPECSTAKLILVVGSDAVLAARILRVANSAVYNLSGSARVVELRTAITRLGRDTIRTVAVAHAVQQLHHMRGLRALRDPLRKLWKHSVQVAATSHVLARRHCHLNPDEALLAGLIHDIGKLYILKAAAAWPGLCQDEAALGELSREWHTGIGRAIVEAWGLSEAVAMATDEHEEIGYDSDAPPDLTSVVLVANLYAKLEEDEIESVDWSLIPAFGRLGLTAEAGEDVLHESADEIRSVIDALKA